MASVSIYATGLVGASCRFQSKLMDRPLAVQGRRVLIKLANPVTALSILHPKCNTPHLVPPSPLNRVRKRCPHLSSANTEATKCKVRVYVRPANSMAPGGAQNQLPPSPPPLTACAVGLDPLTPPLCPHMRPPKPPPTPPTQTHIATNIATHIAIIHTHVAFSARWFGASISPCREPQAADLKAFSTCRLFPPHRPPLTQSVPAGLWACAPVILRRLVAQSTPRCHCESHSAPPARRARPPTLPAPASSAMIWQKASHSKHGKQSEPTQVNRRLTDKRAQSHIW